MAAKMEFKRGDGITHIFTMPTGSWSAGGKLFFAAKPVIDDDLTDATAQINQTYTDVNMTNDGTTVTYTCYFPPSATSGIAMNGANQVRLLGEFEWVSSGGVPSTFPGAGSFINTIVYADIRRATT